MLNLPPTTASACHPAGQWRHQLVREVIARSRDPDSFLPDWLSEGAPAGFTRDIPNGGHFPVKASHAEWSLDELASSLWPRGNHPSCRKDFDGAPPPGLLHHLIHMPRVFIRPEVA